MNIITTEQQAKRARNSGVVLTDRHCQKRVAKRIKICDRKCPGLYVGVTTAGVATFAFKFTDPETGKQRTGWLGVFNRESFTVEHARSRVYGLKAMGDKAAAETLRQRKVQRAKAGKTVDEIVEERIEWMKKTVLKEDGEVRPRIESWKNVASHLWRFHIRADLQELPAPLADKFSPSKTRRKARRSSKPKRALGPMTEAARLRVLDWFCFAVRN